MTQKREINSRNKEIKALLPQRSGGTLSVMQVFPHDVSLAEQNKGEEIFILLRRHIFTNFVWVVLSIFAILFPPIIILLVSTVGDETLSVFPLFESIPASQLLYLVLVWYSAIFTYMFTKFIDWFYNIYLITNERVLDYDYFPLVSYKISEARLDNIEDATQDSIGFFPALFHYGDVFVQTAGQSREFDFNAVPDPAWVRDKLMDLVDIKLSNN